MTRLNVVREGNGPIVVLSHALGCDLHMWDGVAALLARAHTVVRYDHRNHGASEQVAGPLTLQMPSIYLFFPPFGAMARSARGGDLPPKRLLLYAASLLSK